MADCPYRIERANLQTVRKQVTDALCDIDARIKAGEGGGGGGASGIFDCGHPDTVYTDSDANLDCGAVT